MDEIENQITINSFEPSEDCFKPLGLEPAADAWWEDSVITSFRNGWISKSVFGNSNSWRFLALVNFRERWAHGLFKPANIPTTALLCPSEATAGEVYSRPFGDKIVLFLSPRLEFDSEEAATFTLAHEYAHLSLNHFSVAAIYERELAANRQAVEWGFPAPRRRVSM
jgi:hypothetical protein